jgi:hypothetical protein
MFMLQKLIFLQNCFNSIKSSLFDDLLQQSEKYFVTKYTFFYESNSLYLYKNNKKLESDVLFYFRSFEAQQPLTKLRKLK